MGGDGAKTMFGRGVAAHSMMSVYGEHGPAGLGAVHPRACPHEMPVSIGTSPAIWLNGQLLADMSGPGLPMLCIQVVTVVSATFSWKYM